MIRILFAISLIMGLGFIGAAQMPELQTDLSLKYLVRLPPDTKPAPVIILLHGYGSNEQDLFELRNSFPAKFMVVSARAPYPAGQGYQWFDLGKGDASNNEVENSRKLILKFITEITRKYNGDKNQVYLIGFSQGAMMCYEAGLTSPETIKGIAVLSGRLFPALLSQLKFSLTHKRLKIFISHGSDDNRIPLSEGKSASSHLIKLGLKPEFHEYPGMGHSINEQVMISLLDWLK